MSNTCSNQEQPTKSDLVPLDFEGTPTKPSFDKIPQRVVIKEVDSGQIVIEQGNGTWIRFECDCLDALPYCQAQCCGLPGTIVLPEEIDLGYPVEFDERLNHWVLERGSDTFCVCLDRTTRLCGIHDHRPQTCRDFHCTRGANMRGWKLYVGAVRIDSTP